MRSHLQILRLRGILRAQFIDIMPEYIPALPNVQLNHLLEIDDIELQQHLITILPALRQGQHGSIVHHVARVDRDISAEQVMNTGLVPSDRAGVFDIVDHQRSIVDDLAKRSDVEYLLTWMAE